MDPFRVTLVVADHSILDAATVGAEALSRALDGYEVAEGWEVFPAALRAKCEAVAEDPGSTRWGTRLFVLDEPRMLVGWGGFKGPPADGLVELGYAIAPDLRGRGIASAAVREMLREAFSESEVEAVRAHTPAEPGPSTRVLEKTGFARDGEVADGEDRQLWLWRHDRPLPLVDR
ncbi:MAG TPA: GNAT family N-acetyltransferase [Solirubrobacteraceae bacterium]|nr:GNAT family N-acetyltransferase [Solirubrobacteraceae bacterium]